MDILRFLQRIHVRRIRPEDIKHLHRDSSLLPGTDHDSRPDDGFLLPASGAVTGVGNDNQGMIII